MAESADSAVLAAGLEAEDTEGLGDDHALLVVVRWGNTIEGLQALKSGGTTGSLVRDHATDGAPEHLGGSAVVPGTYVQVSDQANIKESHAGWQRRPRGFMVYIPPREAL